MGCSDSDRDNYRFMWLIYLFIHGGILNNSVVLLFADVINRSCNCSILFVLYDIFITSDLNVCINCSYVYLLVSYKMQSVFSYFYFLNLYV